MRRTQRAIHTKRRRKDHSRPYPHFHSHPRAPKTTAWCGRAVGVRGKRRPVEPPRARARKFRCSTGARVEMGANLHLTRANEGLTSPVEPLSHPLAGAV